MMGNATSRDTCKQLTGHADHWPSEDSSFTVGDLAARFGDLIGVSAEKLIDKFTVVPYYAWLDGWRLVAEDLVSSRHGFGCVLPPTIARYVKRSYQRMPLRFCLACLDEDRETKGVPYWHLSHQPEEVTVCTVHNQRLLEGCPWCYGKSTYNNFLLPAALCMRCGRDMHEFDLTRFPPMWAETIVSRLVRAFLCLQRRPPHTWDPSRVNHRISERLEAYTEYIEDHKSEFSRFVWKCAGEESKLRDAMIAPRFVWNLVLPDYVHYWRTNTSRYWPTRRTHVYTALLLLTYAVHKGGSIDSVMSDFIHTAPDALAVPTKEMISE